MDEKADFGIPQDLGKLVLPESESSSDLIEEPEAPRRLETPKSGEEPVVEKTVEKTISAAEQTHIKSILNDADITDAAFMEYLKIEYLQNLQTVAIASR